MAAGHFGAAFRVFDVMWVVLASLEAAVYPELARTPHGHPRVRALTTQAFEALLLVALPIALGLAVGAPWLTGWIYGPGYGPAAPVLAVLGAALACAMLQHLLGVVFLALDRPRRLRAIAALAFTASLVVIPTLVVVSGPVGAAVAVLLVEALDARRQPREHPAARRLALRARRAPRASPPPRRALPSAALAPAGAARLGAALLVYAVVLVGLRPVPGAVCLRLLRGALGRPGPPSAAGVG